MLGDCGTNMAMAGRKLRDAPHPLDPSGLEELALKYVGRFATTRSKLLAYMARKLRERGWAGESDPSLEVLADRMVQLGYIDDRAFALSKARSLTGRGYGERRVRQALALAGIDEGDSGDARDLAQAEAVNAALRFAERRSLGPFSAQALDRSLRERALASMIRAGHRFALARAIIDLKPGEIPDSEMLFNLR
jgi:regulatory protein